MSAKQYYFCRDKELGRVHCQDKKYTQCLDCEQHGDIQQALKTPIPVVPLPIPNKPSINPRVLALADCIENATFIIVQSKNGRTMLNKDNQDIIVAALRGEL